MIASVGIVLVVVCARWRASQYEFRDRSCIYSLFADEFAWKVLCRVEIGVESESVCCDFSVDLNWTMDKASEGHAPSLAFHRDCPTRLAS